MAETARPLIKVAEQPIHGKLKYEHDSKGLHGKVLDKIMSRIRLSNNSMGNRYSEWDRVDEQTRLYINLNEAARAGDKSTMYNIDGTTMREMPFNRSLVIPVSYVVLSVRLSQLMSMLASHKPMWPLEGRGPEDVTPSRLMEACIDYDMEQSRALLAMYQFFMDAEKYGIGVLYDTWNEDYGWTLDPRARNQQVQGFLQSYGADPGSFKKWDVVREYNNWECIDPFYFWPDPRVPKGDIQRGEFCGHRFARNYIWIKERSIDRGGPYFNTQHLKDLKDMETSLKYTSSRDTLLGTFDNTSSDETDLGLYALDHLQIRLIPKDWELSDSEDPEIWWFTVANEQVIIRAHQSSYDHDQFTYGVGESNVDLHTPFNPGNIENLDAMQRFMNWMLNSHFENVRKHLNDMLIYGPSFVMEEDILNPGPARHIRLTQRGEELVEMHNVNPQNFVAQLSLADVTGPHLSSAQYIWEMITRMTATSDPEIGHPTEEKKTLGEIQNIIAGSSKRVMLVYRLHELMCFQPMIFRAIMNRQQFTSMEQYVKITGEMVGEMVQEGRMLVTPWAIQGNFDYAPRSNILPPDPAKSAIAWSQILFGLGKFPQVWLPGSDGRVLDPRLIFNEIARNMGIKHVNQFYRQITPMDMMGGPGGPMPMAPNQNMPNVKVMPDNQVQQEAQKGNIV